MNVYVDDSYRRKGIAVKMMSMLIDEAKAKGVTEITLGVFTNNEKSERSAIRKCSSVAIRW